MQAFHVRMRRGATQRKTNGSDKLGKMFSENRLTNAKHRHIFLVGSFCSNSGAFSLLTDTALQLPNGIESLFRRIVCNARSGPIWPLKIMRCFAVDLRSPNWIRSSTTNDSTEQINLIPLQWLLSLKRFEFWCLGPGRSLTSSLGMIFLGPVFIQFGLHSLVLWDVWRWAN